MKTIHFLSLLTISITLTTVAKISDYAQYASTLPVGFSIVREDSAQDLEIIQRYFPETKPSVLMVASGGCTAALLTKYPEQHVGKPCRGRCKMVG